MLWNLSFFQGWFQGTPIMGPPMMVSFLYYSHMCWDLWDTIPLIFWGWKRRRNASRNLQEGLTEMPCEMYVYPQGNDHTLSPWKGEIIDSKVPAGMEYASSQESMYLVIPCDSRNFVMYVRNKTAHLNTPVYKTMRASMTFDLLLCSHRNRFQVSDPHASTRQIQCRGRKLLWSYVNAIVNRSFWGPSDLRLSIWRVSIYECSKYILIYCACIKTIYIYG